MSKELGPLIRVFNHYSVGEMLYFADIREALAKLDLHVVDGKDMKILEAMSEANKFSLLALTELPEGKAYSSVGPACAAELEKREANREI